MLQVEQSIIRCSGRWTLAELATLQSRLQSVNWPDKIILDGQAVTAMDTNGAWLLYKTITELEQQHQVTLQNWRSEHQKLLQLVQQRLTSMGERARPAQSMGWLPELGKLIIERVQASLDILAFGGEIAVALAKALLRPARLRWQALLTIVEQAGVHALPILALLSFLMGIVIAYQGGLQLKQYGANIFIVELVTLTMLRELAPLVTAIIVAGRTGSAFTAEIGTMLVREEVDALRTLGMAPVDILVLPKLLGLVIALPLLTLFADIASIFGGMVMAFFLLDINMQDFLLRIPQAVSVTSLMIGIGKAPVFAVIIALVGCYQGFQVSGGADSVGRQTTVSVVQAIFLVIVADAVFSVIFGFLGI